jgi:peptidoglycan hydrolase-like protein with peptidoglycan-binding domain
MRSEAICELQNALNDLGYSCGEPDGICGKNTMAGIEAFCKAHSTDEATASIVLNGAKFTGKLRRDI